MGATTDKLTALSLFLRSCPALLLCGRDAFLRAQTSRASVDCQRLGLTSLSIFRRFHASRSFARVAAEAR